MTKNPYEIRLDVLAMAQRMMSDEYEIANRMYMSNLCPTPPAPPTPDEVIAKATALYSFVENARSVRRDPVDFSPIEPKITIQKYTPTDKK